MDGYVTNTNAKSQCHKDPDNVVAQHEARTQEEMQISCELCLKQCCHFTLFMGSTDRLLRREATLQYPLRKMAPAILGHV
jgi:hypothetical protein